MCCCEAVTTVSTVDRSQTRAATRTSLVMDRAVGRWSFVVVKVVSSLSSREKSSDNGLVSRIYFPTSSIKIPRDGRRRG